MDDPLVGNILGAPFRRDGFLIGFMLVGPHNSYPGHAHAANESYHVVAGEAWLCKNDSGSRVVQEERRTLEYRISVFSFRAN